MNFNFESLVKGAKVVGLLLSAFIGIYALAFIGGLVIGVLANVATGGTIEVSTAMNTSLTGLETGYIAAQAAVFNPITTIAALVVVVVLGIMFFKNGQIAGGSGGMR